MSAAGTLTTWARRSTIFLPFVGYRLGDFDVRYSYAHSMVLNAWTVGLEAPDPLHASPPLNGGFLGSRHRDACASGKRREGGELEHVSASAVHELSDDLVDRVDGPRGTTIARRHGEQSIQERVLRVSGLEPRRGAEVVSRRVYCLAARERRNHFGWPMSKPERRHVDERAIVRLERRAQVEL